MSSMDEWQREANERIRTLPDPYMISGAELTRLRNIESAARYYYEHYCQDEAEEEDICIDHEQHLAAQALRDALTSRKI